jgi:neutral ceramidase
MQAPEPNQLFAGFGRCDITPAPNFPNGMWMAQKHARATGIHRRLYISCVLIGCGTDAVALVSYDLVLLSSKQVAAIRQAIHARIGLPPDRIWLYVTHNHAGPVTQDFYDREGAEEVATYVAALPESSAQAAELAWNARRAARVESGTGHCTIGVNRDLNYHGRIITGPNPAGFADPDVGVIRLDGADGRPIAAVVTYGCHPTFLGPDNTLISPDYPGVTRDVFESITGAPCVFLQAGAGNVGPLRGFLADIAEVERCGHILACAAAQTYLGLPAQHIDVTVDRVVESGAPLGMLREVPVLSKQQSFRAIARQIALPTDNPGPTVYDTVERDLAAARERIEQLTRSDAPVADIQHATQHLLRHRLRADRKRMYAVPGGFPLEVCALSVGDSSFISVACEPYAELAVAIKQGSPAATTIFAGYEGPDVIYVAPAQAYGEPRSMEVYNSPFGPQAASLLVEAAISILNELHPVQGQRH